MSGSLDLSPCSNLNKLYAEGTAITGVTFATNGKIRVAHLPDTINTLIMSIKLRNKQIKQEFIAHDIFVKIDDYIIPKNSIQYIKKKNNNVGSIVMPSTYTVYYGLPLTKQQVRNNDDYISEYNHLDLNQWQYTKLMEAISSKINIII